MMATQFRKRPQVGDTGIIWDNATVLSPVEEGLCIKATKTEFEAVASYLLSSLAKKWPDTNYIDDTDKPILDFNEFLRNAASRIAVQMMAMLVICGDADDMKLRTSPDDECVLQQEQLGEWVDVFDFGACFDDHLATFQQSSDDMKRIQSAPTDMGTVWKDYSDHYDGTTESIDPTLTTAGDEGETNKTALCPAFQDLVKQLASDSLKVKLSEAEAGTKEASNIAIGMAVTGLIAAILAIPFTGGLSLAAYAGMGVTGAAWLSLGIAAGSLTAAGIGLWATRAKDAANEVMTDTDAISELACIWWKQVRNESGGITQAVFAADIDLTDATDDHTADLYNVLQPLIQQPITHAVFLKLWKKEIQYLNAGIENDCGCPEDPPTILLGGSDDHSIIEFVGWQDSTTQRFKVTNTRADDPTIGFYLTNFPDHRVVVVGYNTLTGTYDGNFYSYGSGGLESSGSFPTDHIYAFYRTKTSDTGSYTVDLQETTYP